jgi:hypothetical protein
METNQEGQRRRANVLMRSIYDYTMGILWFCIGGFFLLHQKFNIDLNIDPVLATIFGISAMLYGGFRLYRGYRKN